MQCSYSDVSSSIIFHETQKYLESASSLITTLLLNIANEAVTRQLRTVFIRKEAILKYDFVHVHGCSKLVTSNWDNVHFVIMTHHISLD
uniref:Uncharacterized protein n=1 Tax=Schistosoma mansoni TaxID=6183 RepID=A0A5K4EDJ9_SCHMA